LHRDQTTEQAIAVRDMQGLHLLEQTKKLFRCSRVAAVARQFRDNLALAGNMPLAFCNVAFSLREMLDDGSSVHDRQATASTAVPGEI
jgi:hypothetical protein